MVARVEGRMSYRLGYVIAAPLRFAVLGVIAFVACANEDFFAAARKGDAAALAKFLDGGGDVNTKWRYDQTALLIAASRGHVEAVKLLLDRGANVNVKDTFYGLTPLSAATSPVTPIDEKHTAEIVRMLVLKGATGKDGVLMDAARSGKKQLLEALLGSGQWEPKALTAALQVAMSAKRPEAEGMLRAAGAVPPPEVTVDAATLARYGGLYRTGEGAEVKVEVAEGKLQATLGNRVLILRPLNETTFEPAQYPGTQQITFAVSGEKVSGFEVESGGTVTKFSRVEAK